jgi:hypothetical protein
MEPELIRSQGSLYRIDCCADRSLSFEISESAQIDEAGSRGKIPSPSPSKLQTSSQLLSYWSCEIGENSWIGENPANHNLFFLPDQILTLLQQ